MKVFITSRKHIITISCIVLIAMLAAFGSMYSNYLPASATSRELPIHSVEVANKEIALTVNVTWGDDNTEEILAALAHYDVKATFFVAGQWAEQYPESVKAMHEAGHSIQNLSHSNTYLSLLTTAELDYEITKCNEIIERLTGEKPILLRPPYGDYNNHVLDITRKLEMYTVHWSIDSMDWKESGPEEITTRVVYKTRPGSILLYDNSGVYTSDALPAIIDALLQKGYTFQTLPEMIYKDNYTINYEGRQIRESDI